MQITPVNTTNFEGRFIKTPKAKGDKTSAFIDQVINYPINGVTNEQLLARKTFDVRVGLSGKKQEQKPALVFVSSFKSIGKTTGREENTRIVHTEKIDNGIEANAAKLRRHIEYTSTQKNFDHGYNSKLERITSSIKRFFGIY